MQKLQRIIVILGFVGFRNFNCLQKEFESFESDLQKMRVRRLAMLSARQCGDRKNPANSLLNVPVENLVNIFITYILSKERKDSIGVIVSFYFESIAKRI